MNEQKKGRIIRGIGGFYYVETELGLITCRARGKLRMMGETPYVGDYVTVSINQDMTGYVLEIADRKNVMIRPPIANIDMIVIVASKAPPITDTYFIDRIAALAEYKGIEVCVVINKCDEDVGEELFEIYKNTNIKVFRLSAKNGDGVAEFKEHLVGKLSAFTGNSGVGKSTLINAIMPDAMLATGEINSKIGRGRHTTRLVEILKVSDDTWIADTPGFSAFDIAAIDEIKPEDLESMFPDFSEYISDCKFIGCSHIKDSDCAIIEAVENGNIQKSRYESYKKMYFELEKIPKYK